MIRVTRGLKIYLAGKIAQNDWRHDLMPGLRGAWSEYYLDPNERSGWPILRDALGPGLHYVGPFFISCDHGCAHGANSHGVEECGTPPDERGFDSTEGRRVAQLCLDAIDGADIVLAKVRRSAHGTIAEIGYASAMGKRVFVEYEDAASAKHAWFVGRMPGVEVIHSVLEYLTAWKSEANTPRWAPA